MDKFELWREVSVDWPSQERLGGVYMCPGEHMGSVWGRGEGPELRDCRAGRGRKEPLKELWWDQAICFWEKWIRVFQKKNGSYSPISQRSRGEGPNCLKRFGK